MSNETKNILQIGDVMLTEDCLIALDSFQGDANCQIKELTGYIKDSIILLTLSDLGGNVKSEQKRKDTIEYLAQSINLIEQLSAPINNRRTNRKDTDD